MARRLVPSRWAMECLHALRDRDAIRLKEVIEKLPDVQPNETIKAARGGAAFDFAGEGFFDSTAAAYATPFFKKAKHGDTLLHLAMREKDPLCALELARHGADMRIANSDGEIAVVLAWEVYLSLKTDEKSAYVSQRKDYEKLFQGIQEELDRYHEEMKPKARAELTEIYSERAPDRLEKIDAQLELFWGKENELVTKVRQKYGI